jgi:hypothetical protein
MEASSLDAHLRHVAKKDASPSSLNSPIKKWKRSTRQHTTITRAVVDFLLLDRQSLSEVEGEGIRQLLRILEPRYDFVSRHFVSSVCMRLPESF